MDSEQRLCPGYWMSHHVVFACFYAGKRNRSAKVVIVRDVIE